MRSDSSILRSAAIWLCLSLLTLASKSVNGPQVNLGYATYEGIALSNGIDQYLGMRYAAPPVGSNRFRLAQPPVNESNVVIADQHGPLCYSVQGNVPAAAPLPQSEDCLFIDVYAPANATSGSLPVMFWIQGGGFDSLYHPNYNGTGLIEASEGNVIIVTFNYRVGPYGFLASEELAAEQNLNIGLQDQRAAIRWVSRHISQFGGNPEHIVLFGISVGGGSVLLQTLAYGGNPPPEAALNWTSGIAASNYIPPTYEVQDVQYQYDQLLSMTSCDNLDCLRSLTSEQIQAANIAQPVPGHESVPLFPYGPVIDGSLFTAQASEMLAAGKFAKDKPIALGSSHTEGTVFAAQANTSADIAKFLTTQFPDLNADDVSTIEALYDDMNSTFPGVTANESPLYYKLARMYTDVSFQCPVLDFAMNLREVGVPVYLWRDHIVDPAELEAGYIVPHTWELQAIWGPEYATQYVALPNATSYLPGQSNSFIVPQVQAYWTSFALTSGDPNRRKDASAPIWQNFTTGTRLKLETNATAVETVTSIEYARCAAWRQLSNKTHI